MFSGGAYLLLQHCSRLNVKTHPWSINQALPFNVFTHSTQKAANCTLHTFKLNSAHRDTSTTFSNNSNS